MPKKLGLHTDFYTIYPGTAVLQVYSCIVKAPGTSVPLTTLLSSLSNYLCSFIDICLNRDNSICRKASDITLLKSAGSLRVYLGTR